LANGSSARRLPSTLGRTFTVAALGICALYFAGVLAAAPLCGPAITPWFLAGWSATFVWVYLAFTRGRPVGALVIVAIVTVVLPVVALFAMIWPIYGSPSNVSALWSEFRARGLLGGVELFAPLLAAGVATFLISRNNFNAKPT
jgi:hypothetical protein